MRSTEYKVNPIRGTGRRTDDMAQWCGATMAHRGRHDGRHDPVAAWDRITAWETDTPLERPGKGKGKGKDGKGKDGKGKGRLTAPSLVPIELNNDMQMHVHENPLRRESALWSAFNFQPRPPMTAVAEIPGGRYLEQARQILGQSNLVITGFTGSGKTLLANFLLITLDQSFNAFVVQNKVAPQVMNANTLIDNLPASWLLKDREWGKFRDYLSERNRITTTGQQMSAQFKQRYNQFLHLVDHPVAIAPRIRRMGPRLGESQRGVWLGPREMLFMTHGGLINVIRDNLPTHMVMDEVHERSILSDLVLDVAVNEMMNQAYHANQVEMGQVDDIKTAAQLKAETMKLIVASATGALPVIAFLKDVHHVDNFEATDFGEVDITTSPYCITEYFADENTRFNQVTFHATDLIRDRVSDGTMKCQPGCVCLIFINSLRTGEALEAKISRMFLDHEKAEFKQTSNNVKRQKTGYVQDRQDVFRPPGVFYRDGEPILAKVICVDGQMNKDEQTARLAPDATHFKFIIVTNFIESSGTVLNVSDVIITGWVHEARYDPRKGTFVRSNARIKLPSLKQQRGRGGRTMPSNVYYLFKENLITGESSSGALSHDTDLLDSLTHMAHRMGSMAWPTFEKVEANERQEITEQDVENCVRAVGPSGKPLLTLLDSNNVVGAQVEAHMSGILSDQMRLTTAGQGAVMSGLNVRYAVMLTSEFFLWRGGYHAGQKRLQISTIEQSVPWVLMGIAIMQSMRTFPVINEDVLVRNDTLHSVQYWRDLPSANKPILKRWAERHGMSGRIGTLRDPHKARTAEMPKIPKAISVLWRRSNKKGVMDYDEGGRHDSYGGPILNEDYGSIGMRFMILHAIVHWWFKDRKHPVPNPNYGMARRTNNGRRVCPGERPMTYAYIINQWNANNDELLSAWCIHYGLHGSTICSAIDLMQKMAREHGVRWDMMPNFYSSNWLSGSHLQLSELFNRVVVFMFEKALLNVAEVVYPYADPDNEGGRTYGNPDEYAANWERFTDPKIYSLTGELLELRAGEESRWWAGSGWWTGYPTRTGSEYPCGDLHKARYIIYEDMHEARDEKGQIIEGRESRLGYVSSAHVDDYSRYGIEDNGDYSNIGRLNRIWEAKKNMDMEMQRAITSASIGSINRIAINHNFVPHDDASLVHCSQMLRDHVRRVTDPHDYMTLIGKNGPSDDPDNFARVDDLCQMGLGQWTYVRKRLPVATLDVFTMAVRALSDVVLGDTDVDRRSAHVAMITAHGKELAQTYPNISMNHDPDNVIWLWSCSACNAAILLPCGWKCPFHTCHPTFKDELITDARYHHRTLDWHRDHIFACTPMSAMARANEERRVPVPVGPNDVGGPPPPLAVHVLNEEANGHKDINNRITGASDLRITKEARIIFSEDTPEFVYWNAKGRSRLEAQSNRSPIMCITDSERESLWTHDQQPVAKHNQYGYPHVITEITECDEPASTFNRNRAQAVVISVDTFRMLLVKEKKRTWKNSGLWSLPGGGMEQQDRFNPVATARRELQEEAGIPKSYPLKLIRIMNDDNAASVTCVFVGIRIESQYWRQRWFMKRTEGQTVLNVMWVYLNDPTIEPMHRGLASIKARLNRALKTTVGKAVLRSSNQRRFPSSSPDLQGLDNDALNNVANMEMSMALLNEHDGSMWLVRRQLVEDSEYLTNQAAYTTATTWSEFAYALAATQPEHPDNDDGSMLLRRTFAQFAFVMRTYWDGDDEQFLDMDFIMRLNGLKEQHLHDGISKNNLAWEIHRDFQCLIDSISSLADVLLASFVQIMDPNHAVSKWSDQIRREVYGHPAIPFRHLRKWVCMVNRVFRSIDPTYGQTQYDETVGPRLDSGTEYINFFAFLADRFRHVDPNNEPALYGMLQQEVTDACGCKQIGNSFDGSHAKVSVQPAPGPGHRWRVVEAAAAYSQL